MLEQFLLALNVVLPTFILMIVGRALKLLNFIDDNTINQVNNVTFTLLLPMSIFNSVIQSDLESLANVRMIVFLVVSLIIVFAILLFVIPFIEKENPKRGVIGSSIIRCNYMVIGVPIMASLFTPDQMSLVALITAVTMPIINMMAIISLETFKQEKGGTGKLILNVMKNPFVVSPILGIICLFLNIKFPAPMMSAMLDLGKLATPLALLMLGASFNYKEVNPFDKSLLITLFLKLLLIPMIILVIAKQLGFNQAETTALVIFYGTPAAVSTYQLAVQLQGDAKFSLEVIVASTLAAAPSMVILIMMIQSFYAV